MQESSTTETKHPMGMRAFGIIWFGQVISLLGSAMTAFAVTIWVYEGTEKATALALTGFFFVTPLLLLSPVAGALVDRYNRRLMMMISDLASGATTVVLLALHATGYLEVWHLFVLNAINGAFQTFQWPAFSAAISLMVPKEQYGRANGMMELAGSASQIIAPVLAGALIGPIGLTGILMIDIFTFVFAVITLLFVHIPQPETGPAEQTGQGNLLTESIYGFRYILGRPSLFGLQLVFMIGNFFSGIAFAVYAAMILARTGNDKVVFGTVQSVGAIGAVAGGAAMAAWGGPKRLVHGVLGGWILSGLSLSMAGVAQNLPVWSVAGFLGMFLVPIINGSNQAIWQAKVAPDVQGRVFSTRRLIAWFVSPIATLIAGPLVDLLLEPSMAEEGALADAWGWLVGIGDGAGMGLLFVIGGLLSSLVGLVGYTVPAVRDAENILPDHDSPEAHAEREAEAARARESAPGSGGWSVNRKLGTAAAAVTLAVLIVGLGWLQVKVLTAAADEDANQGISEVRSEAAVQPSPTPLVTPTAVPTPTPVVTPTAAPTARPPLAGNSPTSSPAPTRATAIPTSVPPTVAPAPGVLAGELVSYTLTVVNNGPSHATGVVISDTLPPGAVLNWAYFSQGSGCRVVRQAQDTDQGDVVVCGMGALEVGAEAVITFAVALDSSLEGLISSAVAVGSSESDPNQADNLVTRENMVYAEVDLNMQADVPTMVVPGEALSYTLTVVNQGPMDATDVTLTNEFSTAMRFVLATPSQGGGCGQGQDGVLLTDGVTVVCDLSDLGSGQQATVVVVVVVDPSSQGQIESLATVRARETDLHTSNNSLSTVVGIQPQANLVIGAADASGDSRPGGVDLTVQASASAPAVAGEQLTYTVTISNVGALTATGVILNEVLPDGVRLVSVEPNQGRVCGLGQDGVVSCYLGDLDVGTVCTIVLGVLVDPGMSEGITSLIAAAANEVDVDPSNNTMTIETPVERHADLSIR